MRNMILTKITKLMISNKHQQAKESKEGRYQAEKKAASRPSDSVQLRDFSGWPDFSGCISEILRIFPWISEEYTETVRNPSGKPTENVRKPLFFGGPATEKFHL
jgi:hypothetical protein